MPRRTLAMQQSLCIKVASKHTCAQQPCVTEEAEGKPKQAQGSRTPPAVRRQNARCAGPQCTCGTYTSARGEGVRCSSTIEWQPRGVCYLRTGIAIQKDLQRSAGTTRYTTGAAFTTALARRTACSTLVLSRPTRWIDDHVSCAPARVRTRVLQHCTTHAAGARMLVQPAAAGRISWRCVHVYTNVLEYASTCL